MNRRSQAGFTIVELMVVIGIIVMAAGFMTPTITDFLKNRKLEGLRGNIGSSFQRARMKAVTERVKISMVFFLQGVRLFDEDRKTFADDDVFRPSSSVLGEDSELWLELGFAGTTNMDLWDFAAWDERQRLLRAELSKSGAASASSEILEYDIRDLPRVTFQQDGTLIFTTGTDVSTSAFKKEIPEKADLMIKQKDNATVCFIDFRATGQLKYRSVPTGESFTMPPRSPPRPQEDR